MAIVATCKFTKTFKTTNKCVRYKMNVPKRAAEGLLKNCRFYLFSKEIHGICGKKIKNTVETMLVEYDIFKERIL